MPAPIALFAFKRPQHTRRVLESLRLCPEAAGSLLIVFCDGPRNDKENKAVAETRRIIESFSGSFAGLELVRRDVNAGLFKSISEGVSSVLEKHERVVVLEDDLVVSPHFLNFMNSALELYCKDEQVASIHGYVYPVKATLPETFFLRGADCWGWATWRRAWKHFNGDAAKLLHELQDRHLDHTFNFEGAYDYCELLRRQVAGTVSSWAVCWHASAHLGKMFTLYPGAALVRNAGSDGSGTHCGADHRFDVQLADHPLVVQRIPIIENTAARNAFARFLRSLQPGWMARIKAAIRRALRLALAPKTTSPALVS